MSITRAPLHTADTTKWKSFREIAKLLDWNEGDLASFLIRENIRVNSNPTIYAIINNYYVEFDDGSKWPIKRWDWYQISDLAETTRHGIITKSEKDAECSISWTKHYVNHLLKSKVSYYEMISIVDGLSTLEVIEHCSAIRPDDYIVRTVIANGVKHRLQELALRMLLAFTLAWEEQQCRSRY